MKWGHRGAAVRRRHKCSNIIPVSLTHIYKRNDYILKYETQYGFRGERREKGRAYCLVQVHIRNVKLGICIFLAFLSVKASAL